MLRLYCYWVRLINLSCVNILCLYCIQDASVRVYTFITLDSTPLNHSGVTFGIGSMNCLHHPFAFASQVMKQFLLGLFLKNKLVQNLSLDTYKSSRGVSPLVDPVSFAMDERERIVFSAPFWPIGRHVVPSIDCGEPELMRPCSIFPGSPPSQKDELSAPVLYACPTACIA